jgi:hypothetical protein
MNPRLTEEQIEQTRAACEAVNEACGSLNIAEVARRLNLARSSARERIEKIAAMGLLGYTPAIPGFYVSTVSNELDEDGGVKRSWVTQKPERTETFAVPDGHRIKGVSALLDEQDRVVAKWVKTRADDQTDTLVDAITSAFEAYRGRAEIPPSPPQTEIHLATVYNIGDHHHGMYAWARETGAPYDVEISRQILVDTMGRLVAAAPASKVGIVLNLGDFYHADNSLNRTERSGNALDVDTRYAKVLQTGVELMIRCVEMAAEKHEIVIVRCLPGNHDPHVSLALSVALAAFFDGNGRILVDTDPGKFFMHVHGKTMIVATHGDMAKPDDMPGIVASRWPKEWGGTTHRYAYLGHVHHRSRGGGEGKGIIWETFQVLAPKDAWHSGMGYTAGRSMTAITHHVEYGEFIRNTVSVAAN